MKAASLLKTLCNGGPDPTLLCCAARDCIALFGAAGVAGVAFSCCTPCHTLVCCICRLSVVAGMFPSFGGILFAALAVCTHHPSQVFMHACPPNFVPPWAWVCRHALHTPAHSEFFAVDLHLPHVCRMCNAKQTLHKQPQFGGLESTACRLRGIIVRASFDGCRVCGDS